jgi:hypothetical protein
LTERLGDQGEYSGGDGGQHDQGLPKRVSVIEFLFGRLLSPEELDLICQQIEEMDDITAASDEVRGIVERNWPHLLSKLPPPNE